MRLKFCRVPAYNYIPPPHALSDLSQQNMKQQFCKALLALVYFTTFGVGAVSEHNEILKRSEWPEYVNGTNIAALPQVSQTLKRFEEDEKIIIEIRYPGGDPGRLWAENLGRWLVTFGVPARYLQIFPGSGASDQLVISLIDRR